MNTLPLDHVPLPLHAALERDWQEILAALEPAAREAVQELSQRGFAVKLAGHGFVVVQEPAAGTALPRGSAVRLTLSFAPPVTDVLLRPLGPTFPMEPLAP